MLPGPNLTRPGQPAGQSGQRWIQRDPQVGPSTRLKSVEQIAAGFDGDRWSAASEAVAYDMAGEVIGGPAGAPESGTPA